MKLFPIPSASAYRKTSTSPGVEAKGASIDRLSGVEYLDDTSEILLTVNAFLSADLNHRKRMAARMQMLFDEMKLAVTVGLANGEGSLSHRCLCGSVLLTCPFGPCSGKMMVTRGI